MDITIICNPVSGRGKALGRARRFEELARANGHRVYFIATKSADDLKTIDEEIAEGTDLIVSAGGDGTLNALINGLKDPAKIPLTVLATGTANLLARELGIPLEPAGLLAMIERGRVVHFDLMTVNETRRALLVVSVGFDAMVIDEMARNRTGALGFRGYLKPIAATVRNYTPPKLAVYFDGSGEACAAGLAVVSNVKRYAAFFSITDQAEFDSGELDVCLFKDAGVWSLLRKLWAMRAGRLSRASGVEYRRARRIEIKSARPVAVEVDGEYFGTTPIVVVVEAGVVPMMAPAD